MAKRKMGQGLLAAALALASVWLAAPASAQTHEPPTAVASIVRSVLRDPATYSASAMKYTAMTLDWESSQIFFRNGFVERNARFTVSGRSNDTALDHGAGSRKIAADSLMLLVQAVPENLAERTVEHLLIRRYPQHRTLLRVAGHVGRIFGTSYLAYNASIGHVRQWRRNEQLASQLGYK